MTQKNPFKQDVVDFLSRETGLPDTTLASLVEIPKDPALADYAFPCFSQAKEKRMPPAKIASEIAAHFSPGEWLESVQAVGPYVNFFCRSDRLVAEALREVGEAGNEFGSLPRRNETVVIDFGSPNIAKPQGVHHILSTVIGNSIAHILEHLGYDVVRLNYLGDWGTNHGKLIVAYRRWGDEKALAADPVQHMLDIYVRFNEEAKTNPSLEDEARDWFRRLEEGDGEAQHIWATYREATRASFEITYSRLGIHYDSYKGEAAYQPVLKQTMDMLEASGIAQVSQGALIVDLEKYGFPVAMIRKSDGTSTYFTRDVAAALDRFETYHFSKNIYVTQAGQQHSHFNGLFKTLELLGYEWASRCVFVGFGNMSFKGALMSTREGRIILLNDILDMAEEQVMAIIEELNPELPDKAGVAQMIGVGAVIFASLLNDRTRDVVFELESAVKLDGDTSAYIQYNHARIASILRKAEDDFDFRHVDPSCLSEPEERYLSLMLLRFPDVVALAGDLYKPNVLARYLLDLTKAFVTFYHKHHVLRAETEIRKARLALLSCIRTVMAVGLSLLGIQAPDEM